MSASLTSMILSHCPCQPTGPYEEDETERHVFTNKRYHYFSTGNLKANRNWLCFSPSWKKPYCHTYWLFADRGNHNLQWQWIDGVPESSRHYALKSRSVKVVRSTSLLLQCVSAGKLDSDLMKRMKELYEMRPTSAGRF